MRGYCTAGLLVVDGRVGLCWWGFCVYFLFKDGDISNVRLVLFFFVW